MLISAGNEGLLIAIDRYDPAKNVRFLTYATHWIRERILVELDHMGVVRVPAYRQKELRRQLKRSGPETSGVGVAAFNAVEDLDDTNEEDHSYELERDAINRYGSEKLYDAFRSLNFDSRERFVLIAYFGLRDEPSNLRRIATRLQLSTEWVRQIKENCITALVKHFKRQRISGAADVFVG
jgi:RNA polymerase sigma factor (sigma-70 family)